MTDQDDNDTPLPFPVDTNEPTETIDTNVEKLAKPKKRKGKAKVPKEKKLKEPKIPKTSKDDNQVIQLVVDTRESHVIKILNEEGTPHTVKQLDIGDFWFVHKDTNKPIAVFERKTASDMNSSITTGRHRQQRQRIATFRDTGMSSNAFGCGYIMEGLSEKSMSKDVVVRVQGALENLVIRDKFIILPSTGLQGTAAMCKSLLGKFNLAEYNFVGGSLPTETNADATIDTTTGLLGELAPGDFEASINHQRKSRIAGKVFYHMLMVIPHIGGTIAEHLATTYVSPKNLCAFIDTFGLTALAAIKVGKRKLGDSTAKRIHDAFCHGTVTL